MGQEDTGKSPAGKGPKDSARSAPESSGVYLMKDAEGQIIYVGKAKVLKNRLASYFSGKKDPKTRALVSRIHSLEWIVTRDEYEALILENTLIKQHSPRYNINLKDGKTYPVIRVTAEEFPRVFRTRRIVDDGSSYYGPFPAVGAVDAYLALIERLFPLRRCVRMRKRASPCMYYHIGRCMAPCAGKVGREAYAAQVDEVRKLLSGDTAGLLADLEKRMRRESKDLHFERAAALRDAIAAVRDFKPDNEVYDFDAEDRDYLAWAEEGPMVTFAVFQMRSGRLAGRDLFRARWASPEEEGLQEFLLGYYGPARKPPPKIILSSAADLSLVTDWMDRELGIRPAIVPPEGKRHQAALAMALQNAREDIGRRLREGGDPEAVAALGKALGLARAPERIEGFDIAHLEGKFPVASLVVFSNGVPSKKEYRHFRLRSLGGKVDDFASMREASSRRYTRLLNEAAELPDLVMVDGGVAQANAVREVLDLLELDLPVVGLAKRDEELWLPRASGPIVLERSDPALRLLQRVRDETHRFATGLNQRLRSSALSLERLESVEGVGPARAKALMAAFGSVKALMAAEPAVVVEKAKVPLPVAERLLSELRSS